MSAAVPEPDMAAALRRLVEAESSSADPDGLARCAAVIDELCGEVLGRAPERRDGTLVWRRPGDRPVLLLCHYDTVWPPGTLQEFPFALEEGVARGPGAFDMKAGIVQGIHAVRDTEGPVTVLFTPDEEIGSPASRSLIEEEALSSRAVLVLEPAGEGGAVKVARKGAALWRLEVQGRAAHAGLEPERGVNAAAELARQMLAVEHLARHEEGTTVSVTTVAGGTAANVIPEGAWCSVDARMWTAGEARRLEEAMAGLTPELPGARIMVTGGLNRGPMERSAAEDLYARLLKLGHDVGTAEVGGASDGNLTAALGVPTLDGLGAVGGGAHSRDEHVMVGEMPRRAAMLAGLIQDLLSDG